MMALRNVKCFGAGRTGVVVVDWRGRVGEQVLAAESSVLIEAASMQATSGQPLNHALASPVVAGVQSRASLGCEYPHRFDMQPRGAVTKPGYGAITPGTQYTARRGCGFTKLSGAHVHDGWRLARFYPLSSPGECGDCPTSRPNAGDRIELFEKVYRARKNPDGF